MKVWRDWGRRPPERVVPHPVTSRGGAVDLVVVHHTVTRTGPFLDRVRSIQAGHLDHPDVDYFDIAYNLLTSAEGPDMAVGRGAFVQGGATGNGVDARSLSIAVVGSFQNLSVPGIALDNLLDAIAYLRGTGALVDGPIRVEGHRDHNSTSCPGDNLYGVLKEIEAAANAAYVDPPPVSPPAGPTTVAEQAEALAEALAEAADAADSFARALRV